MTHPPKKQRVRALNAAPRRRDGDFVPYWMTSQRRPGRNYALDNALGFAKEVEPLGSRAPRVRQGPLHDL